MKGRRKEKVDGAGSSRTITTTYKTRSGASSSNTEAQVRWYEQPEDDVWEYVLARVKYIRQRQVRRRFDMATFQGLYCNTGGAWISSLFRPGNTAPYQRLSVNVIKSCVDTACARISKDKPRVFVLPNSGDQSLVKKAENLTKFLDGAFVAGKIYENFEAMFRSACIFDQGSTWILERGGEIVSEELKIDEHVIDEVAGMRNAPKEQFIDRAVPRAQLIADFPEFEKEINEARDSWRGGPDQSFLAKNDLVPVVYAWHQRSHEKAKDGVYAVCIPGKTLLFQERAKDYIPIVRFHWTVPTYGPFGMGIAHELEGMQAAISSIVRNVMRSIHLFSVPRVWVEKLSGVSQHTINNDVSVNMYTGAKPVFETPPAASADVYQFLQWLIDLCYKQLGLSQLTAQSEKPPGLNSGVGLRNYQDIETQRFAIVGQRWERTHIEAAEVVIDLASDLYKESKKLAVNVPGRAFVETIDWSDVDMKRDQYDMQAFPTSLLPRTPEGQLDSATELMNSGFLPRVQALKQLRIPNLNEWIDQETASLDNINMCISRIRDKKKYRSPNGIADINLCVTLAMSAWLRADMDESLDPVVPELLLRFLDEAVSIQQAQQAPPTPPPGAQPVVGQAPTPAPAPLAAAGTGPVQAAA